MGGRYRLAPSPGRTQKSSVAGPTLAPVPTMRSPLHDAVGAKTAKALEKALGLRTCGDLLRHYPRRYVERGVLTPLTDLQEDEYVTVQAEVVTFNTRRINTRRETGNRQRTLTVFVVTDGHGRLRLRAVNQVWRAEQLVPGQRRLFAGKVGTFRGQRQLVNPQTQLLDDTPAADDRLLPEL